jgi:DNA-binding MarR family transcriptional regulator
MGRISEEHLAAWREFLRAHSAMLRRISRDLEEAGLPPLPWYDVLAALRDAPDRRVRQVDLAERVILSHSGISRLVDRMAEGALVERMACPTDRRSFEIGLTDGGAELLERMWPVYARGLAEDFLPALGGNPCEVRQMLEMIGNSCAVAREAEAATADPA